VLLLRGLSVLLRLLRLPLLMGLGLRLGPWLLARLLGLPLLLLLLLGGLRPAFRSLFLCLRVVLLLGLLVLLLALLFVPLLFVPLLVLLLVLLVIRATNDGGPDDGKRTDGKDRVLKSLQPHASPL
jgi:hypothetical protein